jgi:hypothetical protein
MARPMPGPAPTMAMVGTVIPLPLDVDQEQETAILPGVPAPKAANAPDTWRRLVGHMLRSYGTPGTDIPPIPEAPHPQRCTAP